MPSGLSELEFSHSHFAQFRKALSVQVSSHRFGPDSAVFHDDNLVPCAGLVPVTALANQTRLAELLAEKVHIAEPKIKSGSANPAPKLAMLIAEMCTGADSIHDVDVVRAAGMKTLFGGVHAPLPFGTYFESLHSGTPASWNRCWESTW